MITINEVINKSKNNLPRIEVEILLSFVLKKNKTFLFSHPEYLLSEQENSLFDIVFAQRLQGKPIAYITNIKEFWSLPFTVNEHTLIPREETEGLVERTLFHIRNIKNPKILELGTGCGAISIAIAHERPDCEIIAVDCNKETLLIAQDNAVNLKKFKINFLLSDWFSNIPKGLLFNVIVTNPPYIAANEEHLTQGDLVFEPYSALCAGKTGLEAILQIVENAKHYLLKSGWICIEHGYQQKHKVQNLLNEQGYSNIHTLTDIQGHDRITEAVYTQVT